MMQTTVRVGVFDDVTAADAAISRLVAAGFGKEHLSIICPDCPAGSTPDGVRRERPAGARAPVAAGAGGAIGAALGGLTAAVGATASGGTALLVAGPILGGAAGAVGGGFLGAMSTRGVEPEIADYYDQSLQRGKVLVAVEDSEGPRLAEAERVLADAGAETVRLPKD